jgi:hypothetical protein
MRKIARALLALGVALALAPHARLAAQTAPGAGADPAAGSGGPQMAPSVPGLDKIMTSLRDKAMGMVEGCDYQKYLDLANGLAGESALMKGLTDKLNKDYAMPVMDPVNMFSRLGGTKATQEATKAESESVLYMLESTCNAVRQADELNRQLQVVEAGRVNVGNAIGFLADQVQIKLFPIDEDVKTQERKARVTADAAVMFKALHPEQVARQDSAWVVISDKLTETLKLGDEYNTALDTFGKQIERMRKDLYLYPEREEMKYKCPEGYPDLNQMDERDRPVDHEGTVVCGPATPERSTQLTAHFAQMSSQVRVIEVKVMNQTMQVEAVRLMGDNSSRKQTERVHISSARVF